MSVADRTAFFRLLTDVAIVANEANTIAHGIGLAVDKICASMHWSTGYLYLCPPGSSQELVFSPIHRHEERFRALEEASSKMRVSSGVGLPGQVLALRQPIWIKDLSESWDSQRSALANAAGFKTGLAFPLLIGTGIVGVLEFFSHETTKPDKLVLELMAHLGTQLSHLIERKHAEDTLKQSEQRFHLMIEGVRDYAIFMLNTQGYIATWNEGARRFKGYEASEIIGQHFSKFYPEEDILNRKPEHELQDAVALGRLEDEGWRVRKDGSLFWANVVITALRNQEGVLVGFSKVTRDLTERKQAEENMRQLNIGLEGRVRERTAALEASNRSLREEIRERQRIEQERLKLLAQTEKMHRQSSFLAEASALLGASLNYEATLANIARLSVPFFADYCVVDIVTEDQPLKRVKIAHIDPKQEEIFIELSRRYPPQQEAAAGPYKVIRTNKPEVVDHITDEILVAAAQDEDHLLLLRALKLRSYLCVPLQSRGYTLGVITFVTAESGRQYGSEDLAFAEELARRCAIAVENAYLYELAQEEIQQRVLAQESLAAEKERLSVTLYSIGDGVITTDMSGRVTLINKVAEHLTGWTRQQAFGKPIGHIFQIVDGRTRRRHDNPIEQVLRGAAFGLPRHAVLIAKDGGERIIADSGAPIHDKDGKVIGAVLVFRDITTERKMEETVLRARNLESVGLLAGGIAHDFNNIMTAILGNVSLAKICIGKENEAYEMLTETERAFARARDLTQQLLTFAKGGTPIKQTASISELVTQTTQFALRGSNVRCEIAFPENLYPVDFDTGQLSQAINNLVINAKQAMPESGVLKITAENTEIGEGNRYLPPGRYIKLMIQDTGVGIVETHLGKIFDPYFTTKQQGSGLGLATTYSIVRQHGGQIEVESKVGKGTTFTVYLPASNRAYPLKTESPEAEKQIHRGQGRVLVMDDEEAIRDALERQLRYLGYDVAVAGEGNEAIALYREASQSHRPFDAVILDLTIPGGIGGKECIEELKKLDPDVNAIVSSGYFTDPVMAQYEKYGFRTRIAKPYQLEELSRVLHEMIEFPRELPHDSKRRNL
jgi:PAS domain S-box-containing protein